MKSNMKTPRKSSKTLSTRNVTCSSSSGRGNQTRWVSPRNMVPRDYTRHNEQKVLEVQRRNTQKNSAIQKEVSLEDFIEITLKLLANKLRERKSLELEIANNHIQCNELCTEIKYLENVQRNIKSKLKSVDLNCLQLEKDNNELSELITTLNNKIQNLIINNNLSNTFNLVLIERNRLRKELTNISQEKKSESIFLKGEIRKMLEYYESINKKIRNRGRQISRQRNLLSNQQRMVVNSSDFLNAITKSPTTQRTRISSSTTRYKTTTRK